MEKNLEYYAKLPYTIVLEQMDDGNGPYTVARVAELPHCLTTAASPQEALKEIEEVKLDWIQSNLEDGLPVPEPKQQQYSGQIRLRMPPTLHRLAATKANEEGVSLNQFISIALAQAVGTERQPKASKAAK